MGYQHRQTAHGFRSLFSRFGHEARTSEGAVRFSSDVVERQLEHAHADRVKKAYLSTEFLPDRVRLMSAWADYLDELERDATRGVVPLRSVA